MFSRVFSGHCFYIHAVCVGKKGTRNVIQEASQGVTLEQLFDTEQAWIQFHLHVNIYFCLVFP